MEIAYPDSAERRAYERMNYVPSDANLDFSAFLEFYDRRRALMRQALREILGLQAPAQAEAPVAESNATAELAISM
jgi:hypothetical protein